MKAFLRSIALWVMICVGPYAMATHIVGGNLGYVYLGETAPGSQVYRYQIYMQFYLNCGDDSNWPDFFTLLGQDYNTPLQVGVYNQDPQNPNADKTRLAIVPVFLTDSTVIEPDLPNGCTVGAGLCTELGVFTGTVDLPLSFSGYHLYFQLCCRNIAIDNIANPNNTGIGYYAFIPPTLVNNSSPAFLGAPTPFLCVNDTTTIVNTASDPDGDQLIFSFETPYNSVSQQGGLQPPPAPLPWTVPEVTWAGGFSTAQPFGTGGYSFINGATGLTAYKPVVQGNYVVAVEVKEFRNSQLIGRIRRDLQLQAITCPANNTPQVTGTLPTTYTVDAGDSLCFNMAFNDLDLDSITITANGTIFDPLLVNPAATITAPVSGSGSVNAQFCWQTSCDQGQDQPYLFSVSAQDNGCPPKNANVVFQVNVVPFTGPTSITGPAQVCTLQSGAVYSTAAIAGATYAWTVNGGNITSGQGTNTIHVTWGAAGAGSVLVSATNALGCSSTPVSLSVNIVPLPATNAGSDMTICKGDTVQLGGNPTGPVGSSFAWTPVASLSNAAIANPLAHPTTTTSYIVQVSNTGCVNRDTVRVTVSLPVVNAGANATICLGDTTQLHATGTGSFSWSPAAGLSATNIANPLAHPVATTDYVVTMTDSVSCLARDTVRVTVHALPIVNAGPDTSICLNETYILGGAPTGPVGSTFAWSPAGGLNSTSLANPTATITGTQTWTVTVTDGNTCVNSDQVTVTALSIPSVDAGPDQTVCDGDSVQLQGSGSGTLHWSPAFGLSDPNVPNPVCTPEGTITYTLTVTGGNLCTNTDQTTVTVNVLPNANAGVDKAICVGDSVHIGTNGPGSFSWTPATGLSATNVAQPYAHPTSTTMYTVTLTDSLTCSKSDSVLVTVHPLPTVNAGNDTTICEGTSAVIGGSPTGPVGATFHWTPAQGLSAVNTANPQASPNTTQTYQVTVTDGNTCSNTDQVQVTVLPAPTVDAGPDTAVCAGGNVQLNGTGTGQLAWATATTLSDTSVANPIATPVLTTTYTLFATGGNACTNSDQVTVTVHTLPTANAGTDAAICQGDSAQLQASGGQSYAWTPAATLNNATISGPLAGPSTTTTYTVVVTDAHLCSASDSVVITVNPVANAGVSANVSTCGSGTVFNLTDSLGGTPDPGGQWYTPNHVAHGAQFDPAFDVAGTYAYVAGGNTPCPDTAFVQVAITNPTVTITGDNEICTGDTTQLTASGGTTFAWTPVLALSNASLAAPLFYPPTTTAYTVSVTDASGCVGTATTTITVHALPTVDAGADAAVCAGLNTTIGGAPTGPQGSTFQWSPASGLNDASDANPTAQPSATTQYTVTVTDANQCVNSDQVTVTVNALPTIDAGNDTSFCLNASVQLHATGTGQFAWSPATGLSATDTADPIASPASTTTYTVTLTDGNSCVNTDDITVTVLGLPVVDAGEGGYLCPGFQFQLHGSGGGTPSWSPAATLNDATSMSPLASPLTTTTYTLTVTDGNGCSANDAVQVQVSTDPPIDAGADQPICQGQQVTLGGNPTSVPGAVYLWDPATGLSDPTAANPTVTPGATTLYTLTVSSDTCTSHDQVLITLQGVAQAAFTMRLEPGCDQLRAFFTDQSSGAAQWHWVFSDGATSDEQNPQHFFTSGQEIVATLTITDVFGCTGTFTQTYAVSSFNDYVDYEIPNVFTPNGDGKNDQFGINSNAFLGPCVTMTVFNRWGQKVFESFGNNLFWDGRNFAGEECITGTYFYTLTLKDMAFNGTVYLNR